MLKNIRGHHFFDDNINSESKVIDLGAYKGDFAKGISTNYGSDVLSVEANPSLFDELPVINNVRFINKAVTSHVSEIKFFIGDNLEGSSIKSSHSCVGDNFSMVEGIPLDMLMLENGIDSVELIKIDIEGAEIELFNSTSDEVINNIDQITVEFHDFIDELNIKKEVAKIKKRMKLLGYYCFIFESPNKDVLFVKKSKGLVTFSSFFYIKISSKIKIIYKKIRFRITNSIKKILRI